MQSGGEAGRRNRYQIWDGCSVREKCSVRRRQLFILWLCTAPALCPRDAEGSFLSQVTGKSVPRVIFFLLQKDLVSHLAWGSRVLLLPQTLGQTMQLVSLQPWLWLGSVIGFRLACSAPSYNLTFALLFHHMRRIRHPRSLMLPCCFM